MVFLIAEIGVNWDGDFVLVEQMIRKAKEFGFNAVKFQAYNLEIVKEHPESSRLMKSTITKENIAKIDELAKKNGIEWFCTPMYLDAVDFVDPYVKRFKIRFSEGSKFVENNSNELVEKILGKNKETIISSEKTPEKCNQYENPKIKWLYCVPKYPCSISDFNFSDLGLFNGFSNHCPKIIAPITASILGAEIIEIHVTSDKSKDFIDNPVSFDYEEQKIILKHIREIEKMNLRKN